jgi:hypothetical protein
LSEAEINGVLDEITVVYHGYEFERRKLNMEAMAYSCS